MPEKTLAIRISEELHRKIRIRLAENGMSLKDYITELVENDILEANSKKVQNISVNRQTVKEAQKVIDFVSEIIGNEYSEKK